MKHALYTALPSPMRPRRALKEFWRSLFLGWVVEIRAELAGGPVTRRMQPRVAAIYWGRKLIPCAALWTGRLWVPKPKPPLSWAVSSVAGRPVSCSRRVAIRATSSRPVSMLKVISR